MMNKKTQANRKQLIMNLLGVMPARGGRPNLSDNEVKAAVAYMVNG